MLIAAFSLRLLGLLPFLQHHYHHLLAGGVPSHNSSFCSAGLAFTERSTTLGLYRNALPRAILYTENPRASPRPPPCPVFSCTREHSISILMSISITSALRGANLLKGSVGGRASSYFQQRRFIKPRDITCATIPSATTRSSPPSRGQTLRDQFKFWDRCSARHKSHPDNEFSSENPGQAQGEEQL